MSSEEFLFEFDIVKYMDQKYPGLYSADDDMAWNAFGKWSGYSLETVRELRRARVKKSHKIRAEMVRALPRGYLPFPWKEQEPNPRNLKKLIEYGGCTPDISLFGFNLLCDFMSALPKSSRFDLSSHKAVKDIPDLNRRIMEYLRPRGKKDTPQLLDLERALDCYRLSACSKHWQLEGHFSAYFHLICSDVEDCWKIKADEKMQLLITQELGRDRDCEGALEGYLKTIKCWMDVIEGPDPYPVEYMARQADFLLGLDYNLGDSLTLTIFSNHAHYSRIPLRRETALKIGHRFLLDKPIASVSDTESNNWALAVLIAKTVTRNAPCSDLMIVADELVRVEDRRLEERDRRLQAQAITDQKKAEAEDQESRRVLKALQ